VPRQPHAPSADFTSRYLRGELQPFFQLPPGAVDAALELPRPVDRTRLSRALRLHAERLGAPRQVFASLERLEHPGSRAVVTGQQTALLLGPLFTLSKAVTAINLARELSSEDKPVVPIFWLASQDADTAEIDHAYVLGLDETLHRLTVPLPNGVPAGRIPLDPAWVSEILTVLRQVKATKACRDDTLQLLERAASRARTFSDWFAALLYALLGESGLLVIDPLEPEVAPLFAEVLQHELAEPLASSRAVNAAAEALTRMGETPQLGRGEGATNLFIEEADRSSTARRLLRFDERGFHTDSRRYTREELEAMLDASPSRITPAAGLRPVTQDAALPTAVTVVGPGELRYFAQLRGIYEHHGVPMPLIWPRMSVTILEPPVVRIMRKFDLSLAALQRDFETVRQEVLLKLHGHAAGFDTALQALEQSMQALTQHVQGIDPTLERTVTRAETRIVRTVETLKFKSGRALRTHDDIYNHQFDRLKAHLLPAATLQERLISPVSFFLKFGPQTIVRLLLELPPQGDHELRL
jgi:bacillithiol biosynthesis cysteine-adding enzyme BshC